MRPGVILLPTSQGHLGLQRGVRSHPSDTLKFVQGGGVCLGTEAPSRTSHGERPLVAMGQEGRKGRASVPEQQEGPALVGGTWGSPLSLQQPSKKQNKRRPEREHGSRLPCPLPQQRSSPGDSPQRRESAPLHLPSWCHTIGTQETCQRWDRLTAALDCPGIRISMAEAQCPSSRWCISCQQTLETRVQTPWLPSSGQALEREMLSCTVHGPQWSPGPPSSHSLFHSPHPRPPSAWPPLRSAHHCAVMPELRPPSSPSELWLPDHPVPTTFSPAIVFRLSSP